MSLITIGVPTYNRKDIVYKTLMHLISSDLPAEYVEFLVSDNASDDGTFELLSTIEDERLSLYQNETNINIDGNVYAIFGKSKTLFTLLMSDEDYVDIDEIKKMIQKLKNNLEYYKDNIGAIIFNKGIEKKISTGIDAKYILCISYISGVMINTHLLKNIEYIVEGSLFPHTIAITRLFNIADIIFYDINIYFHGNEPGKSYLPKLVMHSLRMSTFKIHLNELTNLTRLTKDETFNSVFTIYNGMFSTLFKYDLFYRNEFFKNQFDLKTDEFTIEKYMCKYNELLLDYVSEFHNEKLEETMEYINKTNFNLYKTLNARYKFELAKLKGYEIVMLRREVNLLQEDGWELLGMMQYYGYPIDKIIDNVSEITNKQLFLKYDYSVIDHENCKDINWNRIVVGMIKNHPYFKYPEISL